MTLNWIEYLNLAEELLATNEEEYLRSSISRAYYSVFNIARDLKGCRHNKEKSIHKVVKDTYWNSPNRNEKRIGRLLGTLSKSRTDADYDTSCEIDFARAERSVNKAKEILALFGLVYKFHPKVSQGISLDKP